MTCIAAPPLLSNPILDQLAVQNLQVLFTNELTWLEVCYPIARIGVTKTEEDGNFKYPQVYSGANAEYFDLRPDDNISAFCFFKVNDAIPINTEEDTTNYNISSIFWFNMPRLNGSKGYDFSRELAGHVLKVMNASIYSGKFTDIEVEFNPENIFDEYSMSQADTQFLMYPYGAFKVTFNFQQLEEATCFDGFITGVNGCEN